MNLFPYSESFRDRRKGRNEMEVEITVYEAWSMRVRGNHPPKLHGIRVQWNAPGTDKGAIQLRDRIQAEHYRKGYRTYVYLEEAKRKVVLK